MITGNTCVSPAIILHFSLLPCFFFDGDGIAMSYRWWRTTRGVLGRGRVGRLDGGLVFVLPERDRMKKLQEMVLDRSKQVAR